MFIQKMDTDVRSWVGVLYTLGKSSPDCRMGSYLAIRFIAIFLLTEYIGLIW